MLQCISKPLPRIPKMSDKIITREYLQSHPNEIFVFGDNLKRKGTGGAAILRNEPNTYGFITKKYPSHDDKAYYHPEEYLPVYLEEMEKFKDFIHLKQNCDKIFLMSRIGGGIANKYKIWEEVIEPRIKLDLIDSVAIRYLW